MFLQWEYWLTACYGNHKPYASNHTSWPEVVHFVFWTWAPVVVTAGYFLMEIVLSLRPGQRTWLLLALRVWCGLAYAWDRYQWLSSLTTNVDSSHFKGGRNFCKGSRCTRVGVYKVHTQLRPRSLLVFIRPTRGFPISRKRSAARTRLELCSRGSGSHLSNIF